MTTIHGFRVAYPGPWPDNGKGEFGAIAPYRCEYCGPMWTVNTDKFHDCDRCPRCGIEAHLNQDGRIFHKVPALLRHRA